MRKRNSQRERRRTPDVPEARREAAGAGRKHAAVAARLAAVVDGLQPGARLPGMRSLMRQFGVSQSTLDDFTCRKSFWCNSRDVGDIQSEFGQYIGSVALKNPPHLLVVDDRLKRVGVLF